MGGFNIMKVDVDYEFLHEAIYKLKKGLFVNVLESSAIMKVLEACEGDYFPSIQELEKQKLNVQILRDIDYDKNRDRFNEVLEDCSDFENKYC